MSSTTNILKALGFAGLGAVPSGIGGYYIGHQSGMKRDAETPFSSGHMTYAYRKGQNDVIAALRQQMQQQGARGQVKKASIAKMKLSPGKVLGAGLGATGVTLGGMALYNKLKEDMGKKKEASATKVVGGTLLGLTGLGTAAYTGHQVGKKKGERKGASDRQRLLYMGQQMARRKGHQFNIASPNRTDGRVARSMPKAASALKTLGKALDPKQTPGMSGMGIVGDAAIVGSVPTAYGVGHMKGKKKQASSTKALVGTGAASLLAGTGLGYAGGRAHGKKIDKKTPYGAQHMQYAYRKGQYDIVNRLRKRMQSQKASENVKQAHVNLKTPHSVLWG